MRRCIQRRDSDPEPLDIHHSICLADGLQPATLWISLQTVHENGRVVRLGDSVDARRTVSEAAQNRRPLRMSTRFPNPKSHS